ncbi:MAG: aconitate hydratase, partial [Actinomycetota bacterium]
LVLTLTKMLRDHGVVGKFVEFYGSGLSTMTVADRATLSNMSPEFGATASLFPVDAEVLRYLEFTARADVVDLVEKYTKEQTLFRTDADPDPVFSETLDLDLSSIEPTLAGPKRPQDRAPLPEVWASFAEAFKDRVEEKPEPKDVGRFLDEGGNPRVPEIDDSRPVDPQDGVVVDVDGGLKHGSVVIAAITSCTNTSNPSVMLGAGLLARKAVEAGLETKPWVKTSMAPGSRVVTQYLDRAGLTPYLEQLRFHLVGYGCTTCIGNSGAILATDEISRAVEDNDLVVVAVLSGNRNFEGRIHPLVRASYLASPPLCVAYALAGTVEKDLTREPIDVVDGKPVYLKDIWPTPEEIAAVSSDALSPEQFKEEYGRIFEGDEHWKKMPAPTGEMYEWESESTYIQEPPFFEEIGTEAPPMQDIEGARVLVKVGDSITTDHISPAGAIKANSPAGQFLQKRGVEPRDFNSYGSRRGNHEVMLRGTFANVRLRNELAPGKEGPWTTHQPSGEEMTIYDASLRYAEEGVPLIVLAGKDYGSGSSRDWAAKGTALLGARAVIAQSFERIHRSNLVGMGVLPLQFREGDSAESHGLTGRESYAIRGLSAGLEPRQEVTVEVTLEDGTPAEFPAIVRIDMPAEVDYYRHGGILQMVLRQLLTDS